jgi:hypothetical protein
MSSAIQETESEWSTEERKTIPPLYGCEILLENTSLENANSTSFPSDAHIVKYEINGKVCIDLCRGNLVNIFDMYYDKFGSNAIRSISWGNGRIIPNLWGQQKTPSKSKKRK